MQTTINKTEALQGIQTLAQDVANAESDACAFHAIYKADLDKVHTQHSDTMRAHISKAALLRAKLLAEISADPTLFDEPKSYKFDALNYGFRQEAESYTAVDDKHTIAMIERHLPMFAGTMIKVSKSLIKTALKGMLEPTRERLGVLYIEARDVAFITSKNDKQLRMPE